jgi:hypothetical protein
VLVEFKKEHLLGRSERRINSVTMQPGEKADLPNWQAIELADRGIVRLLPDGKLATKLHSEEFVRERLGTMDKAVVLRKLESRSIKVPKGLDKPGLIDLYVNEVDPGKVVDVSEKGKKGKGGGS